MNDQTCDNVNGTCMDGCNKGFKGELCKTGNNLKIEVEFNKKKHTILCKTNNYCYVNPVNKYYSHFLSVNLKTLYNFISLSDECAIL